MAGVIGGCIVGSYFLGKALYEELQGGKQKAKNERKKWDQERIPGSPKCVRLLDANYLTDVQRKVSIYGHTCVKC